MNYIKMPISLETQTAIQNEFLSAFGAPNYQDNPDWYDAHNVEHESNIAVIHVPLEPSTMPTIDGILKDLRQKSGLVLSHFQLFVCRPEHCGLYHTDGVDRRASLNVPLFNCDVGGIDWTVDDAPGAYRFKSGFTTNMRTERRDLPILDHMTLDFTYLLRVNNWHRINNLGNPNHRIVFSLRFQGNPSFEQVLTCFRQTFNME